MSKRCVEAASSIIARLKELEDPKRAEEMRKYFKNATKHFLGVGTPVVYKTVRKKRKEFADADYKGIVKATERLLNTRILEAQLASVELLYSSKEKFPAREAFALVEQWILNGKINNWASVDGIANHFLGFLIEKDPSLSEETLRWASSQNPWLRRASVVTYVLLARDGKFLDVVYETAMRLRFDKDDFVRKGTGWTLREAGKTDMDRLTCFLHEHGKDFSRVAIRYAIEKYQPEARLELLHATKPVSKRAMAKKSS